MNLKNYPIVFFSVAIFTTAINIAQAKENSKLTTKPPHIINMNGVGTHSCGKYLENTRGLNFDTYKMLYQQWSSGYMAGTSNEARNGENPSADLETYTAWLDKWCADDPSSNVTSGINALGKRLLEK